MITYRTWQSFEKDLIKKEHLTGKVEYMMMIACTLLKPTLVNAVMSTPYFNKRVEALYLRDLRMS